MVKNIINYKIGEKNDVTDLSGRPVVTNVDFGDSDLINAFKDSSHAEH